MRSEGAHRAEVASVEREHDVGPVLRGKPDIDRIGQVQF